MSEQLTGRALDKAIAEALGKRLSPPIVEGGEWYGYGDGRWANAIEPLTPYHADANATLAVCAERGWALEFAPRKWVGMGYEVMEMATVFTVGGNDESIAHDGHGDTLQEAAARALLAALTATADR